MNTIEGETTVNSIKGGKKMQGEGNMLTNNSKCILLTLCIHMFAAQTHANENDIDTYEKNESLSLSKNPVTKGCISQYQKLSNAGKSVPKRHGNATHRYAYLDDRSQRSGSYSGKPIVVDDLGTGEETFDPDDEFVDDPLKISGLEDHVGSTERNGKRASHGANCSLETGVIDIRVNADQFEYNNVETDYYYEHGKHATLIVGRSWKAWEAYAKFSYESNDQQIIFYENFETSHYSGLGIKYKAEKMPQLDVGISFGSLSTLKSDTTKAKEASFQQLSGNFYLGSWLKTAGFLYAPNLRLRYTVRDIEIDQIGEPSESELQHLVGFSAYYTF